MSPWVLLSLGTIVGIAAIVAVKRRFGSYVSVSTFLIANFVLTEQISGMASLTPHGLPFAWNIDLAAGEYGEYLVSAAWISLGALLALTLGVLTGRRKPAVEDAEEQSRQPIPRIDLSRVYLWAALCALAALYALPRARGLASAGSSTHVLETPAGSYKYIVLSNWLACASIIAGTALIGRRRRSTPLATVAVVGGTLAVSVAATSWSGARSLALLIWLPLLVALWPQIRRFSPLVLAMVAAIIGNVVLTLTTARQSDYAGLNLLSPLGLLDWQWGRFSMTPYAFHLRSLVESPHGGTMYASIYSQLAYVAHVVHIPLPAPTSLTSNALIGSFALGSSSSIYIPFGIQGELAFNFSWPGVLIGFFIIGFVAQRLDSWIRGQAHPLAKLLPAYLGSVLVLRLLQGNLGGVLDLMLFTGLPYIVLHVSIRPSLVRAASPQLPEDSETDKQQDHGDLRPGRRIVLPR